MKKHSLNEVTPYLFIDHLVIALSKEWLNAFGEIPKFEVFIDSNGRLTLRSKTIRKQRDLNEFI